MITAMLSSRLSPSLFHLSYAIARRSDSNSTLTRTDDGIDASTTSNLPVQITNSLSLVACLSILVSYFLLRRQSPRIMERPSLVLAVSMATADGLLHTINLFGYTQLPHNFICAFFGGFLYAFPTLTSIFYSFCIALNTQLVFVFSKRPGTRTLKYYVGVPVLLSALICIPALAVGAYGYDASYDYCWYAWNGHGSKKIFTRYFFTFAIWCLLTMLYLVFAAITILHAVFSSSSRINQLPSNSSKSPASPVGRGNSNSMQRKPSIGITVPSIAVTNHEVSLIDPLKSSTSLSSIPSTSNANTTHTVASNNTQTTKSTRNPARIFKGVSFLPQITEISAKSSTIKTDDFAPAQSPPVLPPATTVSTRPRNPTVSRRTLAMRALAFRLLGYILIPTVCILPGVIQDILSKAAPNVAEKVPDSVTTMFDTLNGLVGLFNAILFAVDPALLTLYHLLRAKRRERKNNENRIEQGDIGRKRIQEEEERNRGPGLLTAERDQRTTYQEDETIPDPIMVGGFGADLIDAHMDAANGRPVDLGSLAVPAPVFRHGSRGKRSWQRSRRPSTAGSFASVSTGIFHMRTEESSDDESGWEEDLDRLERYLGGL